MKKPLNRDEEFKIMIRKLEFLKSHYKKLAQEHFADVLFPARKVRNKIIDQIDKSPEFSLAAFGKCLIGLPVILGAGALSIATLPVNALVSSQVYMEFGRSPAREKSIEAIIDTLNKIEGENKGFNKESPGTLEHKYTKEKERIIATPSRNPHDGESGYIDLLQILSRIDDLYELEENILTKIVRTEAYKHLIALIPKSIINMIIWGYIHEELAASLYSDFKTVQTLPSTLPDIKRLTSELSKALEYLPNCYYKHDDLSLNIEEITDFQGLDLWCKKEGNLIFLALQDYIAEMRETYSHTSDKITKLRSACNTVWKIISSSTQWLEASNALERGLQQQMESKHRDSTSSTITSLSALGFLSQQSRQSINSTAPGLLARLGFDKKFAADLKQINSDFIESGDPHRVSQGVKLVEIYSNMNKILKDIDQFTYIFEISLKPLMSLKTEIAEALKLLTSRPEDTEVLQIQVWYGKLSQINAYLSNVMASIAQHQPAETDENHRPGLLMLQ